LPAGAGSIRFYSDFGETATLMLTVASPPTSHAVVALRARDVRRAITDARAHGARNGPARISVIIPFPPAASPEVMRRASEELHRLVRIRDLVSDTGALTGAGFVGLDAALKVPEPAFRTALQELVHERLAPSAFHTFHPDAAPPVVIGDIGQTDAILRSEGGDKYTYRELERVTDLIERTLQTVPDVAKVTRSGVIPERV